MNKKDWITTCQRWKTQWPQLGLEDHQDDSFGIDLYKFMDILNKNLKKDSIVASDAGSAFYVSSQSLEIERERRFILDASQAGMGAALPMGIGISLSNNNREVIVLTGDGSFQTNIQELATIRYHNLPIKIFVWNNSGYLSIRNTQDAFYEGRRFGTDAQNGLFFPNLKQIAESYNFEYYRYSKNNDLSLGMKTIFSSNNPSIIEIECKINQKILPNLMMKNGKSCPLDDMAPFLSDEELSKERIN